MLLGVTITVDDMKHRGVPIHTNTIGAYNWLVEHGVRLED
jgi:hypothetical protein